jgi:uncharacterized membrane protein
VSTRPSTIVSWIALAIAVLGVILVAAGAQPAGWVLGGIAFLVWVVAIVMSKEQP